MHIRGPQVGPPTPWLGTTALQSNCRVTHNHYYRWSTKPTDVSDLNHMDGEVAWGLTCEHYVW